MAAILALGWWALPLTRAGAGADPWALAAAIAACLPLLCFTRADQLLAVVLVLALLPGTVALVLNAVSRTGWNGLDDASMLLYGGLLGLGVLAYARSPRRRLVVVAMLGLGAVDQFGQGWLSWWGGGDVTALMTGTIGWHNPFAAFVAAPLIIAWCLVMRGNGAPRLGAALLVPWLGAGLLLSGSRATLGLTVLSALALVVFAVRTSGELARLGAAVASAPLAVWLLSGTWLMPMGHAVATTALARDEAAGGNLTLRAHYDWAGLQLAGQHPLTGAGFDSYGPAGAQYMPSAVPASEFVHNGWLQAFVDGGVLLALPLIIITGWPALRALRRLVAGRRAGANAVQLGASTALLVLLGHALFDVDWRYPSLVAMYAVIAALLPWRCVAPGGGATVSAGRRDSGRRIAGAALLSSVGVGAVLVALVSTIHQFPEADTPPLVRPLTQSLALESLADKLHTASEDGSRLLQAADLAPGEFATLMARTERAALDDPSLAQVQALALAERGQDEAAAALSERVLPSAPRPPVVLLRAELLVRIGEPVKARSFVAAERDRIISLQGNVPTAELDEWLASHPIGRLDGAGAQAEAAIGGEVGE